jgi:outer membrane protein assembly factor BamB
MMARRSHQALAALLLAALLAACSSDKPKPTPLESITPQLAARQVWQSRVDSVKFPLAVAARSDKFVVAGSDGSVLALAADSGNELWRAQVGAPLSAGVGSDGRFASVVTQNNEVVTLDGGREVWRRALPARVTTAPLVAGERVFVMGVDRAVHAFDALDGRKLWTLQRPGEALTLAQRGVLMAYKDTLVVGQGPRMTGVDPLRGTIRWEAAVATPRGTNEVERLADLVGPAVRVGETTCARAFQSAVGCVNAERGALLWTKNVGGGEGVGGDEQFVFGADGSARITAWRTANGEVAWTNERLLHRELSAPLSIGKSVVFGDLEGYVHFLARDTGTTLQRLPTDGSPVAAAPVAAGGTMLVVTRNGGLFAFRQE